MSILRWLTNPKDAWTLDLPWDCRQCGLHQGGASHTGNTSRARALSNLLDSISSFLSSYMPDYTIPTNFYPTNTLLTTLLSPHNNHLTGIIPRATNCIWVAAGGSVQEVAYINANDKPPLPDRRDQHGRPVGCRQGIVPHPSQLGPP